MAGLILYGRLWRLFRWKISVSQKMPALVGAMAARFVRAGVDPALIRPSAFLPHAVEAFVLLARALARHLRQASKALSPARAALKGARATNQAQTAPASANLIA